MVLVEVADVIRIDELLPWNGRPSEKKALAA